MKPKNLQVRDGFKLLFSKLILKPKDVNNLTVVLKLSLHSAYDRPTRYQSSR